MEQGAWSGKRGSNPMRKKFFSLALSSLLFAPGFFVEASL
jgi:hypothetical protein